ncbi:hypothetical protein RHSIM_Rhsim02G0188800 [Rhododendron simsii]|uniref:Uncharacterized protein n=1 Tax=Rhododendron simsii TaxID=118357 RepID=A0A834HAD3_RHOSS|nr:hypothetical protein RHSIM_Rhsim02G0188800 [Rhododendron simsii]
MAAIEGEDQKIAIAGDGCVRVKSIVDGSKRSICIGEEPAALSCGLRSSLCNLSMLFPYAGRLNVQHIFHELPLTAEINADLGLESGLFYGGTILTNCMIWRQPGLWDDDDMEWAVLRCRGDYYRVELCKLSLAATIYQLRLQRNARSFGRSQRSAQGVIRTVEENVRARINSWRNIPATLALLSVEPSSAEFRQNLIRPLISIF